MENNNRYDEILIRYLVNEVNAEEKEFVENWIDASIENRQYFEVLKHALQLTTAKQTLDYVLDELNVDEKWNRFKQNVGGNEARVVSVDAREQFEEDQKPGRKSVVYRLLVSTAVAASILFVIGLGIYFFSNSGPDEHSIAVQNDKRTDSSTLSFLHHEINTTGKEKRIQLPDGSLIVLADKSEVTYQEAFGDRRDVTLEGKAFFKVAKDKTRPFTVSTGDISTTALGTEFTVTAYQNAHYFIVRLYEGKVVIKAVDTANKMMNNDIYLIPGQEFVYGKEPTVKVKAFKVTSAAPEQIMKEERVYDNLLLPKDVDAPWFMFNNQPLENVLTDLAALYNVKIIYDKKDVQNIYFTSKYDKTVSLETILKQICSPNHLTITRKDSAFIISR